MNKDAKRRTMSLEEIIKNLTKYETYLNNKKEENRATIMNCIMNGMAVYFLVMIGGAFLLEPILNIKNYFLTVGISACALTILSSLSLGLIKINIKSKKAKKAISSTKEQLELACQELERIVDLEKASTEETIRHLEAKRYKASNPDLEQEHYTVQPKTIDTTIYVGLPNQVPATLEEHRSFIHELTARPFEEQLIMVVEHATYKENIPNYSLYELTKEQRNTILEKTNIYFATSLETSISNLGDIPDMNSDKKRKTHIKKRTIRKS